MNGIFAFVDGIRQRQENYSAAIKELLLDIDIQKPLIALCFSVAGFFMSRCGIKQSIYPFSQSFFLCVLLYSAHYKAALFGCAIGWLSLYPNIPFQSVTTSLGCLFVLILSEMRFKVDRERLLKTAFVFFSLINLCTFYFSNRFFMTAGVSEAVIAVVSLFAFDKAVKALFVHKRRKALTDDEAICVVFSLCTLILITGGLKLFTFEVNTILAGAVTMFFAYIFGATVGAAAGVLCGLCVFLSGGHIYIMGAMGVCGFFSGLCNKGGRFGSAATYTVASVVLALYISGASLVLSPIHNTLVSAVILLLIPKRINESVKELLCNTMRKSREEGYYAEKCSSIAREKLDNMASLFKTMSEVFSGRKIGYKEELERIITLAAKEACGECENYGVCWKENYLRTYNLFEGAINEISKDKPGRVEGCIDEIKTKKAIRNALAKAKKEKQIIANKEAGNELLSKQFKGLSTVLNKMNGEIKSHIRFEDDIEQNIKAELILKDLAIFDVCVMRVAGAYRCEITVGKDGNNPHNRYIIKCAVSKFCGMPMELVNVKDRGKKQSIKTLFFAAEKPLKVSSFIAQQAKEGVCGDSFKMGHISESRYMLCLSDGMGSGAEAQAESEACVRLLYSFFKAGFDEDMIFSTVNKLLMLKNTEEMFTTVDMCIVDTISSRAVFTKIGAMPSVMIKKSGGAVLIKGDGLPLGILESVNGNSYELNIEDGDMLIMLTDGVYDVLCSDGKAIEQAVLRIIAGETDIRLVASKILDSCKEYGEAADDMTVLVTGFKF